MVSGLFSYWSQLLRNSAQYKKGDCGNITITAKERPKQVLLSVRDEGTGIPDNELSRIFEKGFTGSNGRKTKSSTGMGLYLSKKLCQKLGLSIRAHSCEGVFTEILLEIPREENLPVLTAPIPGGKSFKTVRLRKADVIPHGRKTLYTILKAGAQQLITAALSGPTG